MSANAPPAPVERFWFTRGVAIAIACAIGGWGAIAWLLDDLNVAKAIFCLLGQLLAINMIITARRSLQREQHALWRVFYFVSAIAGAWFSHEGLHHAWTASGGEIHPAATFAIATLDMLLFWGLDDIIQAPRRKSPGEIADAELAKLRDDKAADDERIIRRLNAETELANAQRDAALATASATRPAPVAPRRETRPARPSRDTVTAIGRDVSIDEIREACAALETRGVTPAFRSVADEMSVPRSRIERTWPKGVPLSSKVAA